MPLSSESSRQNPEMEKYVTISEDNKTITLQVGHQYFKLAYEAEDRDSAEWMRDMLCIALAKVVAEN